MQPRSVKLATRSFIGARFGVVSSNSFPSSALFFFISSLAALERKLLLILENVPKTKHTLSFSNFSPVSPSSSALAVIYK